MSLRLNKVVNALEESHFKTFYHDFGRHPSYHSKLLLSVLLLTYPQGISKEAIALDEQKQ
ncbi:hypothetical protein DDV23_06065 [Streptococcus chenjunshii]|uniref:Transposase InsH N-terminal domain-containing protein n=1 Tax=Streptococcus chenjunshii TaxID=2173853 RepID=A0A372KLJ9_9STRE|nr:hypothetical protein DDV23_06065 [Streptococcus chenjunshii]